MLFGGEKVRRHMKEARIAAGLTVDDVSKSIGVHRNAIERWERGESEPMGSNLISLSRLYGRSPDWLMEQEEKRD